MASVSSPSATPDDARSTGVDAPAGQALDPDTFSSIYEQHLPAIYSYLLSRCRSRADAEDLSQQVFTQALAALPRYRTQDIPITTWLFRIARNLLIDVGRRQRPTISWDQIGESQHPIAGDNVEAAVVRQEAISRLGLVLSELDPEKRDLLALRFAGGLTVPEIAGVLKRSEPAVRSELRRILHTLRKGYRHD